MATPFSLVGTLPPAGADLEQQQLDALRQQITSAMTQRQGAAGEALQQFQQAASAPIPQPSPFDVTPFFAQLASIFSQKPEFAEQQRLQAANERADMLKVRSDNLIALRDNYLRLAEEAKEVSPQEELKMRSQAERVAKAHEELKGTVEFTRKQSLQAQSESAAKERELIAARSREKVAVTRPTASQRNELLRQGIDPNTDRILSTFALRAMDRNRQLAKTGTADDRENAFTGLVSIASQRWHSDLTPQDMVQRLVALRHPFYDPVPGRARYALTNEPVHRKIRGQMIIDPAARARAQQAARETASPWFDEEVSVSGGNPKADLLAALRQRDTTTAQAILQANPALDSDPEILNLIDRLKKK